MQDYPVHVLEALRLSMKRPKPGLGGWFGIVQVFCEDIARKRQHLPSVEPGCWLRYNPIAVAYGIGVLLYGRDNAFTISAEGRMHFVPAIYTALEYEGRFDRFDRAIAICGAV